MSEDIETHTLWLDFPEGEVAISMDLTKWNAAMRTLAEAAAWTVTEESAAEARRVLSAWAWSSADFDGGRP